MQYIQTVRKDFPIYTKNPDLVYLDSPATSLKPRMVLDAMMEYYQEYSSNIHRGIYKIAEKASFQYEQARKIAANFVGSSNPDEIIFTKGATEAINLIATSLGGTIVCEEDTIVSTLLEHHANFVPWQQLALTKKAGFQIAGISENLMLNETSLIEHISQKTKILAITFVSNTTGGITQLKSLIKELRKINPRLIIVVDAAQAAPHIKIDVKEIDCDFLVFSGHKVCGPTGIGVLWGKKEILKTMSPYQFGGDMIREVSIEDTIFSDPPSRFEAGTPPIAEAIGLGAAITYISEIGFDAISDHCSALALSARHTLQKEFGNQITFYNPENSFESGIVTFTFEGIHPHDIAQVLDESSVCVRAGHHCAMPLHTKLNVPATVRAGFYIYNTESEVQALVEGLKTCKNVLLKKP